MLTVISGDIMLRQWAQWSLHELKRLGHAISSWQADVESGWPEERESVIPDGAEWQMELVEAAVNALRHTDTSAYWAIRRHYLDGHRRWVSDRAIRAFLAELDKFAECRPVLTTV